MADIETYQDRIRKYTERLEDEKDSKRRTILQKKIQRDRISVELERLKDSI